jgi:hypothetical protein
MDGDYQDHFGSGVRFCSFIFTRVLLSFTFTPPLLSHTLSLHRSSPSLTLPFHDRVFFKKGQRIHQS